MYMYKKRERERVTIVMFTNLAIVKGCPLCTDLASKRKDSTSKNGDVDALGMGPQGHCSCGSIFVWIFWFIFHGDSAYPNMENPGKTLEKKPWEIV